jgi:nicotinamidase-related amidase
MKGSANGLAVEAANGATGLLVVDMISCWDFPDADKLMPAAGAVPRALPRSSAAVRRAGVPVIYANDNRGRWRSDFGALVELSVACGGHRRGDHVALMPDDDDYFVLKPQQSAFVATPLEQLLAVLESSA